MKNGNTLFFRIEIELINWGNLRLSLSSAIYQWLNLEMYIAVWALVYSSVKVKAIQWLFLKIVNRVNYHPLIHLFNWSQLGADYQILLAGFCEYDAACHSAYLGRKDMYWGKVINKSISNNDVHSKDAKAKWNYRRWFFGGEGEDTFYRRIHKEGIDELIPGENEVISLKNNWGSGSPRQTTEQLWSSRTGWSMAYL